MYSRFVQCRFIEPDAVVPAFRTTAKAKRQRELELDRNFLYVMFAKFNACQEHIDPTAWSNFFNQLQATETDTRLQLQFKFCNQEKETDKEHDL